MGESARALVSNAYYASFRFSFAFVSRQFWQFGASENTCIHVYMYIVVIITYANVLLQLD